MAAECIGIRIDSGGNGNSNSSSCITGGDVVRESQVVVGDRLIVLWFSG